MLDNTRSSSPFDSRPLYRLALSCCALLWLALPLASLAKHGSGDPETIPVSLRSGELLGIGDKCADILGGDAIDGTPVVLYECHDEDNQRWDLQTAEGLVAIIGLDGKCMVPGPVGATGNREMMVAECASGTDFLDWQIVGSFPDDFQLELAGTGECLDVFMETSANGTPMIVHPCHGEANQRWSFPAAPRDRLLLPVMRVDSGSGPATTLMAMRNAGDSPLTVRLSYHGSPSIAADLVQNFDLGPREVTSVNLRYLGLPFNRGSIALAAFDPESLDPVDDPPIYSDFFYVNTQQNFASGGLLLPTGEWQTRPTFCRRWDTRFLNGGGFTGGTTFGFHARDGSDSAVVAVGKVYDEAGNFLQTVELAGPYIGTTSIVGLGGLESEAGVIEWTFADDGAGYIEATYDANGRYSARLPGHCRD